ncbi:hypothetical protein Ccar_10475 [Clostridium carboxidivorans P7]|uniref:Uncharacterized protein n=1 Tax=Clostridium carboxidivorans P7 TaxID=536227 RepID=C6PNZ3_9CLOT|nr:hypothetical protein [Clostridium carboxidivorans]AKN31253.1 hypothetical protein Ccar_10475 [Clostridium carboxidivorans P7]EET89071.1 hypothetical protein CcarbDRAFT_0510 [Clostridium carboxidivorans P7]EFG88375.1 hypothetical protein CLCAR_1950 [Clostridium carboxidivorans P7]
MRIRYEITSKILKIEGMTCAAWIKEAFLKNQNPKLFRDLSSDPIIKNITVITAEILELTSTGNSMKMNGMNM